MFVSTLLVASLVHTALPPQLVRVPIDGDPPAVRAGMPFVRALPARAGAITSIANVRVNDPSQLSGPAGDITPSMAVNGKDVLIVWRVVGTLPTQRLRAAYSGDGGVTFTDLGWLPNPPGNWRWGVDPCVNVDPFDGTFLIGAQAVDPTIPATAVATLTGKVVGGVFTWGTSAIAHATGYLGAFYADQLHMTFDANNFSWHMAFGDDYQYPANALIHRMSVDHGASWFAPDTLVNDPTGYHGLAPRVAFVPGHGPIVSYSGTDHGSWYDPSTMSVARYVYPGFAPAYAFSPVRIEPGTLPCTTGDRQSVPSIAVDETPYLYQSRIYLAWVQSASFATWPNAPAVNIHETEPNDATGLANGLGTTSGHVVGTLSSNSDVDVFAVSLVQGRHMVITPETITGTAANPILHIEIIATDQAHSLGIDDMEPIDVSPTTHKLFTAPRSDTYYLRVYGFNVGAYQLALAYSDAALSPAQDRRDLMTSYSTDLGVSWSTPTRVPVSAAGFDAALVRVIVGNDGRPYLFWLDYSDDHPDGAVATLKTTRSDDGGATWEAPQLLSSHPSDWFNVTGFTKLGYRVGDAATTPIPLSGVPAGASAAAPARTTTTGAAGDLHVTWVDARDDEGNIYAAHFPTGFSVVFVQNDTAGTPGQSLGLRMVLQNQNTVFAEPIIPSFVACQRNWPSSLSPLTITPGSTASVYPITVQIPDTAATGTVLFQGAIRVGAQSYGVNTFIHVHPPAAVDPGAAAPLALEPPRPNPARAEAVLRFATPQRAPVSLAVYDVTGARVRTLVSGAVAAGWHAPTWNLRDDRGRAVTPGVYVVRLTVGGAIRTRRIVAMP